MAAKQQGVQTLTTSETKDQIASILDQVRRRSTRVVVQESGTPVAAIVPADDLRKLDAFDKERAARFSVIDRAREAFRGVLPEEIERETDRILAEIRAEEKGREVEASTTQ